MTKPRTIGQALTKVGEVLYVLPSVPADAPDELKDAIALRNAATVAGRCSCGAVIAEAGDTAQLMHEPGCVASDDAIAEILARHETGG
ncbi:MAG TPA: hypothetical protein VMU64_13570 [Acidimicrobiales bacterium]|nr:hypothetical protein [Acidimicrobiales bacterium]